MDALLEPISETERQQFCVEMMKRFDIQRRNEQFCDVILEVGSDVGPAARLKAHRIVLCSASPFFYNALNSDMKEKKDGVIRMQEASKASMQKVLEFLYTGYVEITEEDDVFDLLGIADFLILPTLKETCSKLVSRSLSSVNSLKAYYTAVRYRCSDLEEQARDFVFANFMSVTATPEFLTLSIDQVEEWISSDKIIVKNEEDVFQVIAKWMERENGGDEAGSFFELFRHVRIGYLSRSYVFNVVLRHPLVRENDRCTAFVLEALKAISDGTEECFFLQPPRNCLKVYEDGLVVCGRKEVLCYLPTENKWYEMKALSLERGNKFSVCACHGKLYVSGTNSSGLLSVERYDPSANSWSLIKSYSHATTCQLKSSTLANFQGHLYVIGGRKMDDQASDTVLKYSPDTNLWQEVAPLSIARDSVCAVADKNFLYAIGGTCDSGGTDVAERFDPETNTWITIAPAGERRTFAAGVVIGGKVYLLGGFKGDSRRPRLVSRFVEFYDPASETWTKVPNFTPPGLITSAVCFKGKPILCMCGKEGESHRNLLLIGNIDHEKKSRGVVIPPSNSLIKLAPLRIPREVLSTCQVHETSQN